jgi:hypothetical protein
MICAQIESWVEQASRLLNWASRPIPSVTRESSILWKQPRLTAGAEIDFSSDIHIFEKTRASTDFSGTLKSTGETPVPPDAT